MRITSYGSIRFPDDDYFDSPSVLLGRLLDDANMDLSSLRTFTNGPTSLLRNFTNEPTYLLFLRRTLERLPGIESYATKQHDSTNHMPVSLPSASPPEWNRVA
jgi:hypothetical protein